MEVNGMQPDEEETEALYLSGFFGSDRPSTTHNDESNFVDLPVTKSKNFNMPTTSISGVFRNRNVSKKTKSVPKEEDNNVGLKKLRNLLVDIRSRHDRIISQQSDLKFDIQALHQEIDENFDNFMDDVRTKIPSKLDYEVHDRQLVVFNDRAKFSRKLLVTVVQLIQRETSLTLFI
ncbi:hypothetical protein Adt_14144 [Abeliophyllum distichum]|uniref:Uncharacterized protein n=1 Tax=Abeliophyllum distichum TaxID=126358 RepID=A0ABD1TYU1_9LAMI